MGYFSLGKLAQKVNDQSCPGHVLAPGWSVNALQATWRLLSTRRGKAEGCYPQSSELKSLAPLAEAPWLSRPSGTQHLAWRYWAVVGECFSTKTGPQRWNCI
jgi:hypothetical protein